MRLSAIGGVLLWFPTLGVIPVAEDNHGSETLLAIVGAAPAKVVIGNSVSVVDEKAPFKPPYVAHAWHWYAPFCRFRGYHG